MSGKTELFEILARVNGSMKCLPRSGYRAEYAGFVFHIYKRPHGGGWQVWENRSGLHICDGKTKAESTANLVKYFTPERIKDVDFDHLESVKNAAPVETITSLV